MLKRCLLPYLAMIILPALVSCGSGNGEKLSREVTELVRYYQEMKMIGLAGQVEQFQAMRDSYTNAEVDAYYKLKGWVVDSVRVSSWAYNWPDVAGLPLEQDSTHGLWRRLVFSRCGLMDKDGREQCLYSIIMFRKNADEWKVSSASRLAAYRFNDDGTPCTLDQISFHKMFRLPPSFEDLKPKERSPDMQPRPVRIDTARPPK